ncbi:MAG: hypothetical protein K6D93_00995 [Saccharofermentans sp.]|jgi:YegS/Rv2252/BmrU family lipid kinase|nr:hypothetical protein [Saccharofermentans sp.]
MKGYGRKVFIVNSRADARGMERFKAATALFGEESLKECEIRYTEHAGHASEIASEILKEDDGNTLVIACGGDGTVHEVANVLAGSTLPMAIIPLGTGNDFARSVMDENHRGDCEYCVSEITKNDYVVRPIDLIKVESFDARGNLIPESSAWCNNVASIGLDTEVQLRAKSRVLRHPKSAFIRKTSYPISAIGALFGNRKFEFRFECARGSDVPETSGKDGYTLISICNGSYYGSGFCPAPKASVKDGLLDVCAIDNVSLPRALYLISKYKKGLHEGKNGIDCFRTTEITVEATGYRDLNGNYDGEDFSGRKVKFTCVRGALNLAFYD